MPFYSKNNVFLFVPNLIGYSRIVFAFISFYYMSNDYILAAFFYFLSSTFDAIDGYAARYFNQCSRFGAMLDQLTDRCATLALLMILTHLYPRWLFPLQMSAVIDIASHWLYLHAADLCAARTHKNSSNALLNLYYTSRPFLFFMCAGNEAFYWFLYVSHFSIGPLLPPVNVGLWPLLAFVCFPVALVKFGISLIHLITAAIMIADFDLRQRETDNSLSKQQ